MWSSVRSPARGGNLQFFVWASSGGSAWVMISGGTPGQRGRGVELPREAEHEDREEDQRHLVEGGLKSTDGHPPAWRSSAVQEEDGSSHAHASTRTHKWKNTRSETQVPAVAKQMEKYQQRDGQVPAVALPHTRPAAGLLSQPAFATRGWCDRSIDRWAFTPSARRSALDCFFFNRAESGAGAGRAVY